MHWTRQGRWTSAPWDPVISLKKSPLGTRSNRAGLFAPLIFIFPLLDKQCLLKCTCFSCSNASSSAQLVGMCQELFAQQERLFLFTFALFSLWFSSIQNPGAVVLQYCFYCFALCLKPRGEGKLWVTPSLSNLPQPSSRQSVCKVGALAKNAYKMPRQHQDIFF